MNASLNERLKKVKWGEYKLGDLFHILSSKKRFDANKVTLIENGGHPYVVRQSTQNGKKGNIDKDSQYLNPGNTISFGQDTATMFYQQEPYFTGDKIKILKPKYSRFGKKNAQFFLAAMRKTFYSFSWGSSKFNVKTLKKQIVKLPIDDNGFINFDFMESFIEELQTESIAQLADYLKENGLDNYKLTDEEKLAIDNYENLTFKEYNLTDIFEVKNTSNILSRDIVENSGTTPYLCASADNNSVSSYITYDKMYLEKGNCIFIGGKTFVVSYQEKDFYSNDSHNLALYLKSGSKTKLNQLYLVTCVYRSLKHKYSWGDSVSKTKIKNDKIYLPSVNGKINSEIMETFISAIQKLVIKDVVLYAENKIQRTKDVKERNNS